MGVGVMREAKLGTAVIEEESVLRPACEHAIGFVRALCHQVVDQYAKIAFMPLDDERRLSPRLGCRVDPCNQSLARRFLITGSAVDLARKKQAFHLPRFE